MLIKGNSELASFQRWSARNDSLHGKGAADRAELSSGSVHRRELKNQEGEMGDWLDELQRVRHLEQENNRLTVQIKDIEVVEKKEKNNMGERFEAEKVRDEERCEDQWTVAIRIWWETLVSKWLGDVCIVNR